MPYEIKRGSGPRPYKIVRKDTGQVVGTSRSRSAAEGSIKARQAAEHGGKLRGRPKR